MLRQATEEPGDRAPAPGPLRLVQVFVNTNDLEGGPELLHDTAALRAWLVEAGLLRPDERVSDDDHARAIALREAIRALVSAHAGLPHDPASADVVNAAAERAGLRPVLDGPATRFEPSAGGVDGALGQIVAAIHAAVADGSWQRLKACERDVCRWAFYDHSKNRSGHWCSMAVCGQREKNRRAYRRRRARAGRRARPADRELPAMTALRPKSSPSEPVLHRPEPRPRSQSSPDAAVNAM